MEILIPIAFFAMIAAIALGPSYLRTREREKLHDTLRLAYDKGQPVPPELIEALTSRVAVAPVVPTPERDLRRAVVFIALGLGMAGLGYGLWYGLNIVSPEAAYIAGGSTAGTGAIPGFIGVAYLILWAIKRPAAGKTA
ncbi:hypothetical protein C5708_00260 [Caulobacter sp. CCUG 60055]|uniref:DUF6249 domain-containing protein n=1 Tax=Caulobacter sp. CCUG 60055 TaxID=2100090 RepID=UPI001FA6F34D|nr:DUF6249 domain-containing protein [Caulobacter sp. CCUG 60055]MBQ1540433.1 hypothetical protein [Caulobacteraceae bacterium]MCI3178679.1 hypothetical protein [Caulobacter sp. CCUG 60055]